MTEIEKFLRTLSSKEREAFFLLMAAIKKNFKNVPHMIPLTGKKNYFRVRMGRYRIIFYRHQSGIVEIRRICRRNEATYKNL